MKKLLSSLFAFGLLFTVSTSVFADSIKTDGYDESLNYIGISLHDYINMPDQTKAQWTNVTLETPIQITKYYRMIETTGEVKEESFGTYIAEQVNSRASSGTSTSSWSIVRASISKASTGDYAVSGNVTLVNGTSSGNKKTHVIGLATNNNCSVVANSELMKYTYTVQGITHTDNVWSANAGKNSNGYAFRYDINYGSENQTIYAALRIKPNVTNVTLIDGIVHFGRFESNISPSFGLSASFSGMGASMSFNTSTAFSMVGPTHVQINR